MNTHLVLRRRAAPVCPAPTMVDHLLRGWLVGALIASVATSCWAVLFQ